MWVPGANGSVGYCKVMKNLHFYDDVNDVAWESKKKKKKRSSVSIYKQYITGLIVSCVYAV